MLFIPLRIIAMGDKAQKYLDFLTWKLRRCSHSSSWLVYGEDLAHSQGIMAVVDGSKGIRHLPKYVLRHDYGQELIILDIADKPRPQMWKGVYSYMWIPTELPYVTLWNFFFMTCCNGTDKALSCRYNKWKWFIKGAYKIKIYKASLYPDLLQKLGKWPVITFPPGRYIVQVGVDTGYRSSKDKFFQKVKPMTNRLPAPSLITILNAEFSKQDAFIAILQLEPL